MKWLDELPKNLPGGIDFLKAIEDSKDGTRQLLNKLKSIEHCIRGHAFTESNTRIHTKTGAQICRACEAMRSKAYRDKIKTPAEG